ncbi:MAG: Trk system potassium transporter TrkA [Pseudomonadales bacterium]|nr:Trk system potassium transporter TrkA [Pseudomonadales bacterium]MDP6471434.1 Trk system potassium transporter TrkA [Pseudomonadales bacterium]MDP6828603.1 Trk system potassium transporter TrkA [Pseudomonadales bacterium]MDP6973214.1 Trk system potassium transporter TrkA [Pseudomonadales bacterium]
MKILILGAGQVGGTLAENLANEAFDITLVDQRADMLEALRARLDIQTVQGHASHPHVLRQAGADDADMLVAVTASDEVNMVACQVCYSLFRTPTRIARVRSSSYLSRDGFFTREHMPIDVLISPEKVVTNHIRQLLEHPGALQVLDFADGRVQLVAVRAYFGGPLVGQELRRVRQHMPKNDTKVAAIFRRGRPITPEADTVIEPDDEVFFIAASEHINAVMAELRHVERAFKRVTIAGGGNIGERLARAIEPYFSVKVIEYDRERCEALAESLHSSVVLHGEATNRDLLVEENIENCDAFCAVTNDDEVNIMSSLMAKRLGVRQVMSLISKPAYVDLVQGGDIDIAISPQQATTSSLLTYVRRGDVARVHSLRRGAAEAMEAIAHGDARSSKVVGRRIRDIELPPGTTIGAIVRGDEVIIAHRDVEVASDDHIILFLIDKKHVPQVERLFQVGITFF